MLRAAHLGLAWDRGAECPVTGCAGSWRRWRRGGGGGCREVGGGGGGGVLVVGGDIRGGWLGATDGVSLLIEDVQYTCGEAPCVDASERDRVGAGPALAGPVARRWPGFTPPALAA